MRLAMGRPSHFGPWPVGLPTVVHAARQADVYLISTCASSNFHHRLPVVGLAPLYFLAMATSSKGPVSTVSSLPCSDRGTHQTPNRRLKGQEQTGMACQRFK